MRCRLEDPLRLLVEDRDELAANHLALLLRVGHARQPSQKSLARIDRDHAQAKPLAHVLLHLGKLILAQHAVVDEDAGQPVADGARHQHRGHAGIDTAAQSADRMTVAYLRPHALHCRLDKVLRRPIRLRAADVEHEVA